MKKDLELIKFIEIRYADPISSMDLTDNYLLFGSMLGSTKSYSIKNKRLKNISNVEDDYISGVKIYQNKFYICIGNAKYYILKVDEDFANEKEEINNSDDNNENGNGDCLTMLNNNYLIRTFINFPAEPNDQPLIQDTRFLIKNIFNENEKFQGEIKMSNYCVPFDFDGKKFIIIDFFTENKRKYILYDVISKQKIEIEDKFEADKIGHISHLKIIKDDTIFIVRDYNICEIRSFELELKKKLNIKSSEILAFDLLFDDEINEGNNNNDIQNSENTDINKEKGLLYIIILDLDCNIILYNYRKDKSEILINLEKDEIGIDEDIKDQRFFCFGYPYYIKFTKNYIAVSSDYGCILLKYSLI